MQTFTERRITCPHCNHSFGVTVDASNGNQEFYDDCPACCHPIHINVVVDEVHDTLELRSDADDEQIF
ncbi:CPXCG motif-containing cysteine-rich protein [Vibrio sp. WXL103]|uniref:CPXCG motif-containing cysteine-rich protein n=1 Tax=unclassified Vibrio TaxID=2614977 RepID=UPI003EC8564D